MSTDSTIIMKINILTIFPEMFAPLRMSMLGRAIDAGIIELNIVDIRDYTADKHRRVDDTPYGGGAGMVMQAQPIMDAYRESGFGGDVIYMSPRGEMLSQKLAGELSEAAEITILCGHYEGVDQRAIDLVIDEELSVGDYVLTGGEIPAMVVADAVARLIPGVLGCESSAETESFSSGLLEYPQYTRPREFEGLTVPEPLLNGNHREIENWQLTESLVLTLKHRPEMARAWLEGRKFSRAKKRVVDAAIERAAREAKENGREPEQEPELEEMPQT